MRECVSKLSLRLSFDAVLCCKIAVSMLDCVARSQFYCGMVVQNCSFSRGLGCEIAVSVRDCVSKLQSRYGIALWKRSFSARLCFNIIVLVRNSHVYCW